MPEHEGMGLGAKHAKQPISRLGTFSRYVCTYAEGQGREMVLAGSFVPLEAMPPLTDVLQEEGTVSSSVP